ncbi:MAG TPA: hypothetical protein VKZ50_01445 [bacterium]|nr:hypothetical protein [bacterium]
MRRPTNAERLFNGNDLGPSWQPWVFFADTGSSGGGEQPGGGGGGSSGAGAENSGNGAFGEIGGSASREQQTGPGGNVEFSGGTGSLEASQAGNGSNGSNEPAFGSPDLVAAGPPASANIGPGPTGSNVAGVGLGNPGIGASGTIQGTTFAANSAVGQFFAGAARGVYDVVSSILGGLIPGFGQVFGYGVRAAAANSNQAYGLSPDLSVSGGYGTTGYGTGAQGEGGGGGFLLTAERLLFGSGGGGAPASDQTLPFNLGTSNPFAFTPLTAPAAIPTPASAGAGGGGAPGTGGALGNVTTTRPYLILALIAAAIIAGIIWYNYAKKHGGAHKGGGVSLPHATAA